MILDMNVFLDLKELMGDATGSLIERYITLSDEYISKIEHGIASGNAAMVEEAAHPLKSSSLQVSAVVLHRFAATVEHEAQTGHITPALKEAATQLRPSFEAAAAALRQAINAA